MTLRISNTLAREIQEFKPLSKEEVRLYTCGPTVYNHVHIGNLRAYINADILKRALGFSGFDVNWVMNITDVEDKIIATITKKFGPSAAVAELKKFTDQYFQTFLSDLEKININPEDISFVKVSDKIADIQEYIVKLIEKGYAYKADDGSTYFSISKYQEDFGDYGTLIGEKFLEGKKIGARVKVDEYDKEDLSDFALWKSHGSDDGNIFWEHPVLGQGRPGWHIECTLINYLKFPDGTDIHTGGIDLIFPHHTNEIAQAQALYKPFVKYWAHSEHIIVNGQKMAKSAGNFFVLKDLEEQGLATGASLRYLVLQSHYKSKMNINEQALKGALTGFNSLVGQISQMKDEVNDYDPNVGKINENFLARFTDAIENDLNTAQAMALLSELLSSDLPSADKLQTVYKFDEVLGLGLENLYIEPKTQLKHKDIPKKVHELLEQRKVAKAAKDYVLSDKLRDQIQEMGFEISDSEHGMEVYKK